MKTAVITGARSGIGADIANKYLTNGYKVYTISRGPLQEISSDHKHIQADLSDWHQCDLICDQIKAETHKLDVLVNNVGKSEWRSISNIDPSFFDSMMALNVASYVAMTKGLFDILRLGSTIINISSMAGKRGTSNNSVYCATKFAVNGLTQSWAKEFGPKGIRVNAICPVLIRSEGLEAALIEKDAPAHDLGVDAFLENFKKSQAALGRLPTGSDVADFCFFLTSPQANSISGQCVNLDCGVFPQ